MPYLRGRRDFLTRENVGEMAVLFSLAQEAWSELSEWSQRLPCPGQEVSSCAEQDLWYRSDLLALSASQWYWYP